MGRSPDADDGLSRDLTRSSAEPIPQSLAEGRFPAGTLLAGRYRIVALLGRGGMGEVYRVDDLRLRQSVALKVLPPRMALDPAWLARFHNEVRLARQVTHPNVCRVHDVGEADGLTFLTMEHVDGEDLGSLLRRVGRLPGERAVMVARQICAGLAAAHERGVLHRDLKPANVMIDGRGQARITDFGLAMIAGDVRAGRESAGTPAYMAPEQLEGRPVSERTDLYALGLVLYEMFTGRRAFEADSLPRLIELRHFSPPPAPTSHTPDLDPRIDRAILQCLEADPARRPASATAVAATLSGPDALAAAVAAGETPSPEMVAAAGAGTALHPGLAVALAALAVAAQVLGLTLLDKTVLPNRVLFDKPPEALAERARAILDRIGVATPADRAYGFAYDRRYLQWIPQHDRSPERWERLSKSQPAAVHFWYRQSARPMDAYNDSGVVTPRDPPLEPGMAFVRLDTQGRLVELAAPAERAVSPASKEVPRWDLMLAEAGLDPGMLRPSSDSWLPPVFADTIAAFDGTFPEDPEVPLHVELAAYAGRPVAFRIRGPWETAGPAVRSLAGALNAAMYAVFAPVLVLAILLARRNLRLGRGDRRGAFRIAAFAFCGALLYAALRYGHPSSAVGAWLLFAHAAGSALFEAAAAWILYVALEPYVRRRWPEALVSWNRLLAGRFNDPLIGRDLLVAALASAVVPCAFGVSLLLPRWTGEPAAPLPLEAYLGFLPGPSRVLAWLFGFVAVVAVTYSLTNLLLFVLLRSLLRRTALAAAAFWLLWMAVLASALPRLIGGSPSPDVLLLSAVAMSVPTFLLVRHGLFALAAYTVMSTLLVESSAVTHFGAWFAAPAVFLCALLAGLMGWGLYASLSARPLRWEGLLEK